MKKKKLGCAIVAGVLSASLFATSAFAFDGFTTYKGSNMVEYYGSYDSENYPYEKLDANFTTDEISVDGEMDAAYSASAVSKIDSFKKKDGYGLEPGNQTYGELRTLWNGPDLFLYISVYDDCVMTCENAKPGATTNPAVAGETTVTYPYASWGGFWATWAVESTKETSDSVAIAVDLYNDRTTYELDTAGIVTIDPLGNLYYYSSSNIPSLGSALGDPNHPEYMDIIKAYAAAPMYDGVGNQIGYSIEIALSLEGTKQENGTQIGVDVKINDVNDVVTSYSEKQVENPDYVAPVSVSENNSGEVLTDVSDNSMTEVEEEKETEAEAEEIIADETTDDENEALEGPTNTSEQEVIEVLEEAETNEEQEEVQTEETQTEEAVEEEKNTVDEFITVNEPVYEVKKSADIFWSHNQDSLYTDFDHEHTNSTDWGVITLAGWNGADEFAYSDWTLSKILRYIDSASFAKGVYTQATQSRLDRAVSVAKVIVNSTEKDRELTESAVKELKEAFEGLRWADTKYPDPAELKKQVTLPDTYKFFNSDKVVTNNKEWEARREEILDLAQFYEYGYKPEYDNLTITSASYHHKGDKYMRESRSNPGTWKEDVYTDTGASIAADVTVGNVTKSISYDITFPSDEQIEKSGHKGSKLPIVLSFDGTISSYTDAGLAMITVPSVCSDTRTNDYAWNNRTGLFYELYPYSRNGEKALKEVSNEMAEAWAASVVIDMLELCEKSEDETIHNAVSAVDVEKLAVTGFSINGKYAFVTGVFDDRIDVVIPGAAGATGPSPWRYVYRGQEYDWTDTAYVNSAVDSYQVAWGTEVIANSVRHNRVRETEMFRKFMTPGHFYEFEEDAYGYATRLPYDQNDLIATLAPRAIIIENTVNDYNDGCTADCLGAEIAKCVYNNLGYDADDLVKFNLRNLKTGDPHGNDGEQRGRSAQYLNYYFFGTEMSEETDNYLGTDPYSLKISNNRTESPYDYYWGGFNTITGGKNGVNGNDGWYSYKFPTAVDNDDDDNDEPVAEEKKAEVIAPANVTINAVPGRRAAAVAGVEEPEEIEEVKTVKEAEPEPVKEEIIEEIPEEEVPEVSEPENEEIAEPEVPLANNDKDLHLWIWFTAGGVLLAMAGVYFFIVYRRKSNE